MRSMERDDWTAVSTDYFGVCVLVGGGGGGCARPRQNNKTGDWPTNNVRFESPFRVAIFWGRSLRGKRQSDSIVFLFGRATVAY